MPDHPIEDISVNAATGEITKTVHGPESEVYKARVRAEVLSRLADLDKITGPRCLEGFLKGTPDQYVLDKIAEKEALRQKLAGLG